MKVEEALTGGSATAEVVAAVRPSMKERQRQLREDAILDASIELLKTKGFNAMTLEDITEAIGISRPTLYQHFKSKEDVVMHISLRCRRQSMEFLAAQDPSVSARNRLEQFCDWVLDMRFGSQALPFNDMMKVISAQDNEDPVLVELETRFLAAFVGLVEEAQAEGGVRRDLSAFMVAQVLIGLVKNYTLDDQLASGATTIAEIKDTAMKMLLVPV